MYCATIEEAITVKYYVCNVVSIRVRDFQMQSDMPHKCFWLIMYPDLMTKTKTPCVVLVFVSVDSLL